MGDSEWRRRRLLIVGYHGISLADEHEWAPTLYMPRDLFRKRLEILRQSRCNVLPLDEAVQRLYAGTLPERSVVLTFDDGYSDFYRVAYPLLAEYGFPATVYLTTYYSEYNRPVFDVACGYLLWLGRGKVLNWPEVFGKPFRVTSENQVHAAKRLKAYAASSRFSAKQKDSLIAELAERVGANYEDLCKRRLLHLMTPSEAQELARCGIDFQLHTHRHRTSRVENVFLREIEQNREHISRLGSGQPNHFCYPGGLHLPEFLPWLEACQVTSATTCQTGLASPSDHRLLLPRLMDSCEMSAVEFQGWVSGAAALLPSRAHEASMDQLSDQNAPTDGEDYAADGDLVLNSSLADL